MSLEKAVKAKHEAAKLDALLAAWRKKKHPRIAELIDRVSEPLVQAAGGAVKAKSVPERTKMVLSMLRKPSAIDVGRVLLTDWPGTWETALPVVRALAKLPDDPRVAQLFARQVDLTQYVSLSAITLYRPLFKRLDELGDVRTKELLVRQLGRTKNTYYARRARALEERSVAALQRVKVPALTPKEEAWLTQLEAPFASASASEKERGKSGEELLAAVYASPADLGLRAVYGDWLTQHGDPRGELINLQLAPPTPKSESRIRALIKQHWRAWSGPLADWFTDGYSRGAMVPEFKAGFLSRCWVQEPKRDVEEAARKLLDAPEWRTVERLESWISGGPALHEALSHPNFAQVKELGFVLRARDLVPLAESGAGARLERIRVWLRPDDAPVPWDKLRSVRWLSGGVESIPHVRALLPQLEVLVIESGTPTDESWRLLERAGVKTVEYEGCRLTNGFTSLERLRDHPSRVEDAVLAAFPKMSVAARKGPLLVKLDLRAPLRSDALVERLWETLTTGFGVTFDALDVGGVAHDLGQEPVKRLQVRSRNDKTSFVRLSHRQPTGQKVALWKGNTDFVLPMHEAGSFLTALRSLAALVPPDTRLVLTVDQKTVEGTAGALASLEHFVRAL